MDSRELTTPSEHASTTESYQEPKTPSEHGSTNLVEREPTTPSELASTNPPGQKRTTPPEQIPAALSKTSWCLKDHDVHTMSWQRVLSSSEYQDLVQQYENHIWLKEARHHLMQGLGYMTKMTDPPNQAVISGSDTNDVVKTVVQLTERLRDASEQLMGSDELLRTDPREQFRTFKKYQKIARDGPEEKDMEEYRKEKGKGGKDKPAEKDDTKDGAEEQKMKEEQAMEQMEKEIQPIIEKRMAQEKAQAAREKEEKEEKERKERDGLAKSEVNDAEAKKVASEKAASEIQADTENDQKRRKEIREEARRMWLFTKKVNDFFTAEDLKGKAEAKERDQCRRAAMQFVKDKLMEFAQRRQQYMQVAL